MVSRVRVPLSQIQLHTVASSFGIMFWKLHTLESSQYRRYSMFEDDLINNPLLLLPEVPKSPKVELLQSSPNFRGWRPGAGRGGGRRDGFVGR